MKFEAVRARFGSIVFATVASLSLSGCMHPVSTSEQAIAVADKACDDSWGRYARSNNVPWHVDRSRWEARVEDDHWRVWIGDENKPELSVNVPRDGHPLDANEACDLQMVDEGPAERSPP